MNNLKKKIKFYEQIYNKNNFIYFFGKVVLDNKTKKKIPFFDKWGKIEKSIPFSKKKYTENVIAIRTGKLSGLFVVDLDISGILGIYLLNTSEAKINISLTYFA